MQASELFKQSNTVLLDGGMGTMLQASGLKLGAKPEELNITNPELIESIHAKYAAAGSRIVNANTFGASAHKLAGSAYSLEEIIAAGIANCKRACAPYGALTALDVGPLGELLEPSGTLAFEDAVSEYARIVRAGAAAGADLIFFETFTDLYELKAALLAAKENSGLLILASMSFEAGGRTFTGCTVESFGVTARGLGANAVGINCSLGPKEIFPMAKRLAEAVPGDFPVFVKPNAGLPRADGSGYDITPQLFAMEMKPYRELHLFAAGGCCGTTPEFIKLLNSVFAGCVPGRPAHKMPSVLCTPVDFVNVDGITVVGERINPTGKKRFQQALREEDMNYVLEQAVSQVEAGAQVLDVNVGAPMVDEALLLPELVQRLTGKYAEPLSLDSSHAEAIAAALPFCPGSPLVNSISGEADRMEHLGPLCRQWGAPFILLPIQGRKLPVKAADRIAIIENMLDKAAMLGIPRRLVLVDVLALAVASKAEAAREGLETIRWCAAHGLATTIGLSNISFGLPARELVNTTFLSMAMGAGLSSCIANPSSGRLREAKAAGDVLMGHDRDAAAFVNGYAMWTPGNGGTADAAAFARATAQTVEEAVILGDRESVVGLVEKELEAGADPFELVRGRLIPAITEVGSKYERREYFLPQLLRSAETMQTAFARLKPLLEREANAEAQKIIVVATVEGDIHDIGKNIVSLMLGNHGFKVVDLGKDVKAEAIVEAAVAHKADLIGLSALMTTTMVRMRDTVDLVKQRGLGVDVMVGGAVVTPAFAESIGANYSSDAVDAVRLAKSLIAARKNQ